MDRECHVTGAVPSVKLIDTRLMFDHFVWEFLQQPGQMSLRVSVKQAVDQGQSMHDIADGRGPKQADFFLEFSSQEKYPRLRPIAKDLDNISDETGNKNGRNKRKSSAPAQSCHRSMRSGARIGWRQRMYMLTRPTGMRYTLLLPGESMMSKAA